MKKFLAICALAFAVMLATYATNYEMPAPAPDVGIAVLQTTTDAQPVIVYEYAWSGSDCMVVVPSFLIACVEFEKDAVAYILTDEPTREVAKEATHEPPATYKMTNCNSTRADYYSHAQRLSRRRC